MTDKNFKKSHHRTRRERARRIEIERARQLTERCSLPSPSRSSHIRTFVARPQTHFSHHESQGGTLAGLGVAKASGG